MGRTEAITMDEYKTPGCSCNGYVKAVADAEKYREKALMLEFRSRLNDDAAECDECERPECSYCSGVIDEVDGE